MKILLDTSVFISLFAKDDHFESALSLFRGVLRGHEGAFCSMTLNELIWVLKRTGHDARFIRGKWSSCSPPRCASYRPPGRFL